MDVSQYCLQIILPFIKIFGQIVKCFVYGIFYMRLLQMIHLNSQKINKIYTNFVWFFVVLLVGFQIKIVLIDLIYQMIKAAILILALVALASSVSYKKFDTALNDCRDSITTCTMNFYTSPSAGEEEIQCGQDIQKARICFSNYKQCFASSVDGMDEEMPVVCWQCYMDIDSDISYFNNYIACIKKSASGSYLVLSVLLLLALLIMA